MPTSSRTDAGSFAGHDLRPGRVRHDGRQRAAGWQPTYDVQLQYNVKDATEAVPSGEWVNIGIATPMDDGNRYTTEHIWAPRSIRCCSGMA